MRGAWERLSWPQVVALAVMIAGVVSFLVLVPEDKLAALPWEWLASILAILLGGAASATLPPLVGPARPPAPPPSSPVERVNRAHRREDGSVEAEILIWISLFFAACVVATACSGCGGALHAHARVATVAEVALGGADETLDMATATASAACADEPCVDDVEARATVAAGALDAVAVVLDAYMSAISMALHAGESPDVLSAIGTAALRLVAAWGRLADALRPLGVDLPSLPAPGGES